MKRVAVITGVLGGIGSAAARVFAAAGWHIIGIDRREEAGVPWISHFIRADLSDSAAPARIIREISGAEGWIDALINNAAVQICRPLVETSIDEWETIMAVNVRSVYLLVQAAHPFLKARKGAVVNVGSVHALATSVGMAAYAASKGALLALTRAAALELAADGIRVNAVLPGAVETDMLRSGLKRTHLKKNHDEDPLQSLGSRHPLGRVGRPDEIGKAIFFLADNEQSAFTTGQTLVVDGGALAKLSTE